ncbi:MAG: hypothetical protein E7Z93_05650 [Cyanobacteria bacterium SIG32]|nr:hypothetical protein [Cyanobacteria bacterium SIG32]
MKKILATLLMLTIATPVFAIQYEDVLAPKQHAYRLGISDIPEKMYIEAEVQNIKKEYVEKDTSIQHSSEELTFADLSLKRMSSEIATELALQEKDMMSDLSLLWKGAATQSDTINFALYKLANPDADKPDEKSVKKVLSTIASMSTLVGAGMGNPILATGSLIGGNVLGIMSQDTKALNYKYTKVNDADMIILVRKIEDLQQRAINLYYDYMTTREQLKMVDKLVVQRKKNYELAQNSPREIILITDAYYRTALDTQAKIKSDFLAKRASLEQFVGNEVFSQFEKELIEREK